MKPSGPYRRPLLGLEDAVGTLYRWGFSLREIAVLFGCSVIGVKGALGRAGQSLRPRGHHASRDGIALRHELIRDLDQALRSTTEENRDALRAALELVRVRAIAALPNDG